MDDLYIKQLMSFNSGYEFFSFFQMQKQYLTFGTFRPGGLYNNLSNITPF